MVCRLLLGTGRGAVWLAHLVWDQGVAGSNPVAPTKIEALFGNGEGFFVPAHFWLNLEANYREHLAGRSVQLAGQWNLIQPLR